MTAAADIPLASSEANQVWAGGLGDIDDLALLHGRSALLGVVRNAAEFAGGDSWLDLLATQPPSDPGDGLLVLVSYCYLRGIYRSFDVAATLETDPELADLRDHLVLEPERLRRFRREHRRALTDCLTRALVLLASPAMAGDAFGFPGRTRGVAAARRSFSNLEPYYLAARERIERAMMWDSMALDE